VTDGSLSKTYNVNVTKVNKDYRGRTPLGIGQVTAAASREQTGYPASNIVDGNEATIWRPSQKPTTAIPQSVMLELDVVYTVSHVSAKVAAGSLNIWNNQFKILISVDNTN